MIHEYKTGRSICSFVEFCAWAGVIVGAITMLLSIGTAMSSRDGILALVAVVPAFTFLLLSFVVIIIVQMARATMDGSVAAQKNVIQSQKHHDEMMRNLRDLGAKRSDSLGARASAMPSERADTTSGSTAATDRDMKPVEQITYNGKTISIFDGKYRVFGKPHDSLEAAKAYIDSLDGDAHAISTLRREPVSVTTVAREAPSTIEYKGQTIERDGEKLVVDGVRFSALERAQRHIDGKLDEASTPQVTPSASNEVLEHRGVQITKSEDGQYIVKGRRFRSQADAEVYIDFATRRADWSTDDQKGDPDKAGRPTLTADR